MVEHVAERDENSLKRVFKFSIVFTVGIIFHALLCVLYSGRFFIFLHPSCPVVTVISVFIREACTDSIINFFVFSYTSASAAEVLGRCECIRVSIVFRSVKRSTRSGIASACPLVFQFNISVSVYEA